MHSQPSIDMRCRIAEALLSGATNRYLFVDWSSAVYGYDIKPMHRIGALHWEAGEHLGCCCVLDIDYRADMPYSAPIADWDLWAYDTKLQKFFWATGE